MLQKITSYLNTGFDFYGIEIFDEEEKTHFQVAHLHHANNELLILKEFLILTWDELSNTLSKNTPVCLSYNGKNVLDKLITKTADLGSENLIEASFPNLDVSRFYFNLAPIENSTYISIVEKKTINTLIQRFSDAQLPVINLNIGLSALSSSKPYLVEKTLITSTKKINFSNNLENIPTISKHPFSNKSRIIYTINGLEVKQDSLIGFSSVLNHLISPETIKTNYEDLKIKLRDEAKYSRRFQVLLWPIITGFLILLLANFFIFNFYFQKVEILNQDSNLISSNKEKLIDLKKVVAAKQLRVETILGNKNSKTTLILDNLASSVPNTILLDNIVYQPLLKPIRDSRSIELGYDTLTITGESSNTEGFSNWIDTIEDFEWVVLVETLDYGFKTTNRSYFTLKLTIDAK